MKQPTEEKREKARLASLLWRRAHGIGPRKTAQRPWLALGVSRSTYYRRRKQAREREAVAAATATRSAVLDRLEWQLADLRADLAEAAKYQAITAGIISEMAALQLR
jgi:hypothetical protein